MSCYEDSRLDSFAETIKGTLKKIPIERHAKILASRIAKTIPQRTDANTLIYQVFSDGKSIIVFKQYIKSEVESAASYKNSLEKIRSNLEHFREAFLGVQLAHSCTDSFGKGFFESGGQFKFIWKDGDYKNLFEYTINKDNCK